MSFLAILGNELTQTFCLSDHNTYEDKAGLPKSTLSTWQKPVHTKSRKYTLFVVGS